MTQIVKVPRIDTSPEILRYLQRIAQSSSSIAFPLSKGLTVPDVNLRNPNETTALIGWPAANRAIYVPFSLAANVTVDTMGTVIGATGGNIDYGIYDESGSALFRNGGHAATLGTYDSVAVNIALATGFYYVGVSADGVAIELARQVTTVMGAVANSMTASGIRQEASAYPLPATATFASPASAYLPMVSFGLSFLG